MEEYHSVELVIVVELVVGIGFQLQLVVMVLDPVMTKAMMKKQMQQKNKNHVMLIGSSSLK